LLFFSFVVLFKIGMVDMICWLIYLPFILVGLGAFIYLVICNKNEWHERNNIF